MAEEIVRVRLVFEDSSILSKSQKKEGLKQSWILVKPEYHIISDFSSYLLEIFDLHDSCPHGLVLSMDGFVLPTFESTCILKDKDIVSVSKRRRALSDTVRLRDVENSSEEIDVATILPALPAVALLANEEFQEETGGHQSESEEDEPEKVEDSALQEQTVAKKRKASTKIEHSKRKKSKLATAEVQPKETGDKLRAGKSSSPRRHCSDAKKSLVKKVKSSDLHGELGKMSSDEVSDKDNKISKCNPKSKSQSQGQEISKRCEDAAKMSADAEKQPSRSARRKKAKRQWLRELKQQQKEPQQKQLDNQESIDSDDKNVSEKHKPPPPPNEVNGDIGDEVVPVQIRPGHIRFEPLDDVDQAVQDGSRNEIPVETFQWNGITSKRKGQKWGTEKSSYSKRNDQSFSQEFSQKQPGEADILTNGHLDYEKLAPYFDSPEEGDVIAYKLIELSSSWTPEISSFSVGKISWYDAESKKVTLVQVPEYPVEQKMDEEALSLPSDASLYKEDGSLEIDFSSLLDVRLVRRGSSSIRRPPIDELNKARSPGQKDQEATPQPSKDNGPPTLVKVNGPLISWEEINQALRAKKAELSQGDNRKKKENSGRSSWSYKALRGSALGPTMAYLRAQDGL